MSPALGVSAGHSSPGVACSSRLAEPRMARSWQERGWSDPHIVDGGYAQDLTWSVVDQTADLPADDSAASQQLEVRRAVVGIAVRLDGEDETELCTLKWPKPSE